MAEDIVQRLVFDDSQVIETFNKLLGRVEEVNNSFKKLNEEVGDGTKKSTKQAKEDINKYGKSLTDIAGKNVFLQEVINKSNSVFGQLGVSIDGVINSLKKYSGGLKDTIKILYEGTKQTDEKTKVTKILTGQYTSLNKALEIVGKGLRLFRVALISTGIGAIILALSSLVAFLTRTQRGLDLLGRAGAIVGNVFGKLGDKLSDFGEKLFDALSNPKQAIIDFIKLIGENLINRVKGIIDLFKALGKNIVSLLTLDLEGLQKSAKEAGTAIIQIGTGFDENQQNKIAKSITNLRNEISELVRETDRLKIAEQELNRERAKFIATQEKLNEQLAKEELISRDKGKTLAERLKAAIKAGQIENAIAAKRVDLAKRNLDIIKGQNELLKNLDKDYEREYEAEAELSRARSESYRKQIRLNNTLNEILKETLATYEGISNELNEIASELGLISEKEKNILDFDKKIEQLKSFREQLQNIGTGDELKDFIDVSKIEKSLELVDKAIIRLQEKRRRTEIETTLEIERLTSQRVTELQKEINALKKLGETYGVDVSAGLKVLQENLKAAETGVLFSPSQIREQIDKLKELGNTLGVDVSEQVKVLNKALEESLLFNNNLQLPGIEKFVKIPPININFKIDDEDLFDELRRLVNALIEELDEFWQRSEVQGFLQGASGFWGQYNQLIKESFDLQLAEFDRLIEANVNKRQAIEDELNKELEFQRLGLANNVTSKQQEVDALLAEEERLRNEQAEIRKKAQEQQLIADTITQASNLITAASSIIDGFSKIPIVGLPLGIAAVIKMFAFFAKVKIDAFKAVKRLSTGADRIADYFGEPVPGGKSDIVGRGKGYRLVDEQTGVKTNVIISGREMLLPEKVTLQQKEFFKRLKKGEYNFDIAQALEAYKIMSTEDNQNVINNTIINQNNSVNKQWVVINTKDGRQALKLMEIPKRERGSIVYIDL